MDNKEIREKMQDELLIRGSTSKVRVVYHLDDSDYWVAEGNNKKILGIFRINDDEIICL